MALQQRLNGTCNWILDRPIFQQWLEAGKKKDAPKLLWINGQPGIGKTILCAHIVRNLSPTRYQQDIRKHWPTFKAPVAHFFFDHDFNGRDDAYVILRSWTSQIASYNEDAFEVVHRKQRGAVDSLASLQDIREVFQQLLEAIPGCILIIDGLDECGLLREAPDLVQEFILDVKHWIAGTKTRVLLFSRDVEKVQRALHAEEFGVESVMGYRISVEDVQEDVIALARHIAYGALSKKSQNDRVPIFEALVHRCEGQFLWLRMQEPYVQRSMSNRQLQSVIEESSSSLKLFYNGCWSKIDGLGEMHRERAFSLLRWATFSFRPLTVGEITEAVLSDRFEGRWTGKLPIIVNNDYVHNEIVGLCTPFLEVRKLYINPSPEQWTVHLPHFTIRQYLLEKLPIPNWTLPINLIEINHEQSKRDETPERLHNTVLAKSCLEYVSLRQVWNGNGYPPKLPLGQLFNKYAASAWYRHVNSGIHNNAEIVRLCVKFLSKSNPVWECWARTIESTEQHDGDSTADRFDPLYIALKLHLPQSILLCLTNTASSTHQSMAGAPPTDSGYASTYFIGEGLYKPTGHNEPITLHSIDQDFDDAATEYSTTSTAGSNSTPRQEGYIRELADALYSEIESLCSKPETQRRVSEALPELLKSFALLLGCQAPTQMHRDIMVFVHKYRR